MAAWIHTLVYEFIRKENQLRIVLIEGDYRGDNNCSSWGPALYLTEHELTKNSPANCSVINLHLKRLCVKFLNNTLQLFRAKNYSYMRSRDRIEIMSQILEAAAAKNEHSGGATESVNVQCISHPHSAETLSVDSC
jgi:hypothetical protein